MRASVLNPRDRSSGAYTSNQRVQKLVRWDEQTMNSGYHKRGLLTRALISKTVATHIRVLCNIRRFKGIGGC